MRMRFLLVLLFVFFVVHGVRATIFGTVRGIVHDPQHRPVAGAVVEIKSATSDFSQSAETNSDGEFSFSTVALGDYSVTVTAAGFSSSQQRFTLASDTSSVLHFMLAIAPLSQTTVVTSDLGAPSLDTVTPTTLVDRSDIERTPGADSSNSLAMITNFTPGSYMTHNMLHMRGGHQTTWLIDGVPIPDTNIGTSIAPRVDPKDVDYLEVLRGSYNAQYGDRTYGEFNILPKSGFDMNNRAEIVATVGSFYQTNDQVNFGGHTQRFAYYASLNGNRSNLGLQTPVAEAFHAAENGFGGFTSLLYNRDSQNQFRLDAQARRDFYQIPYDPDPNSDENQQFDTSGLRDTELESDSYALFSWVHTFGRNAALTVSPFYHYNRSAYNSPDTDTPIATTSTFASHYGGGQAVLNFHAPKNDAQIGIYSFAANQNELFGLLFNDGSGTPAVRETNSIFGSQEAFFASDKFSVTSWLTLIAGLRATHFSGGVVENATYPRLGGTLRVPRLNWVFRAFWGRYYQPPPLVTITGPLLSLLQPVCDPADPNCFAPLHGERDEEHQFGVTIPFRGWSLDVSTFETHGVNFLDHNNIGESDVFIPVTIAQSRVRGMEVTVRSPRMWKAAQVHLAYSNQMAQARGPFTGGLIVGLPDSPDWRPLDHDQRNTFSTGFDANLPRRIVLASNLYYGSGFVNGSPDAQHPDPYLPGHAQLDLSIGKDFGERFSVALNALNVTDNHLLIDNSLTFGGFHYNRPREIYAEFRWRFHY